MEIDLIFFCNCNDCEIVLKVTDASSSSSAVSNVSVRPRRVQLRRHSAATSFHNRQNCRRSTNQDSVRTRAFAVCGRDIWNTLPPAIRTTDSYPAFRRSLKHAYLFHLAFNYIVAIRVFIIDYVIIIIIMKSYTGYIKTTQKLKS